MKGVVKPHIPNHAVVLVANKPRFAAHVAQHLVKCNPKRQIALVGSAAEADAYRQIAHVRKLPDIKPASGYSGFMTRVPPNAEEKIKSEREKTMTTAQWKMNSKVGPLYLVATEKGLQGVFLNKQKAPMVKTPILTKAMHQLEEYFKGKRQDFDLPLDIQGTTFQKRVWEQLRHIPYGKTVSYRDIAQRIRNKGAFRAVGNANGKNPLCIVIPCHRVIAADGSLGGYGGGLKMKTQLLDLERLS